MHSSRLSESTSTATTTTSSTSTATSVSTPVGYQLELAAGQRQQSSFVGTSTTIHTPDSTDMPVAEHPFARLRLLAEACASLVDPFEALATHQTITFDDPGKYQEQPDDSSSLSNEPSQPVQDTTTRTTTGIPEQENFPSINEHFRRTLSRTVPETLLTAITGDPRLVTGHYLVGQKPDSTDKWIIMTGDKIKPFKCGHEGCNKHYTSKRNLQLHLLRHTDISGFRCLSGKCTGKIRCPNQHSLKQHKHTKHTRHGIERRFRCDLCKKRFERKEHLKFHRKFKHFIRD